MENVILLVAMGLIFNNKGAAAENSSTSDSGKALTSENVRFLKQLGFNVNRYGYAEYKERSNFRRNPMGKRIPYPFTLQSIKIKQ